MKAVVLGLVVVVIAGLAGCGGGGGGQTSNLATLPSDLVGTYQVGGLNLPDDQLGIKPNGDVIVNSEASSTRGASSQTRIGSCSPEGTLSLGGTWKSGGTDYAISANGTIVPATHCLTLQATLTSGTIVTASDETVSGSKIGDHELPPSPPDYPDDGGDDILRPPPPPTY